MAAAAPAGAAGAPAAPLHPSWAGFIALGQPWSNAGIAGAAPRCPQGPSAVVTTHLPPANPAGAAAIPVADCGDRADHALIGTSVDNCSDGINNPVPLPPNPGFPGGAAAWHSQMPCTCPAGTTTCLYCRDHTVSQPWYQAILADLTTPPPPVPLVATITAGLVPVLPMFPVTGSHPGNLNPVGAVAYTRFLAHLCKRCEIIEQQIYHHRRITLIPAPVGAGAGQMRHVPQGLGWPVNTCTCFGELEGPGGARRCLPCTWPNACANHDKLLLTRQQNDDYLRRHVKGAGNAMVQASGALRTRRQNNGQYRACRCGMEIKYDTKRPVPEVYMCLGCEGVLHVGAYAGVGAAGGVAAVPAAVRKHGYYHGVQKHLPALQAGIFRLRR